MSLLVFILIYRQVLYFKTMTNEEILEFYNKMVEFYGRDLPDPEHQPLQFAYLVKMYKYYTEKQNG